MLNLFYETLLLDGSGVAKVSSLSSTPFGSHLSLNIPDRIPKVTREDDLGGFFS